MDGLVSELVEGARAEMAVVAEHGGAVDAVDYMKTQLVESHRERVAKIERGDLKVVGQNTFQSSEPSPLQQGEDGGILTVDPGVERGSIEAIEKWRSERDDAAVGSALDALSEAARDESANIMEATIACAKAGVSTGEWAARLREVFGEYRAPTGVGDAAVPAEDGSLDDLRDKVERVSESLGRRVKILVGKPGLDGHSNGAEQIAVRARDAGMDVVYEGIRLTPARIASTAVQEGVHVVGLSILSGSHNELIPEVIRELREAGADVPVVVGGIIPSKDAQEMLEMGVARVYTPKDFEISRIMGDIVELVAERNGIAATAA
jgi:(2R)-ethylmalonyl-CoA mutase